MGRQEMVDVSGLGRRQGAENVSEVVLRIKAATAATHQDRSEDRTAPSGLRVPNK